MHFIVLHFFFFFLISCIYSFFFVESHWHWGWKAMKISERQCPFSISPCFLTATFLKYLGYTFGINLLGCFFSYLVLFWTFRCLQSVFHVCHLGDKSMKWIHLKAQDWCHSIAHKCVTFGHYLKVSTLCVLRLTLTRVVLLNRNSIDWICI